MIQMMMVYGKTHAAQRSTAIRDALNSAAEPLPTISDGAGAGYCLRTRLVDRESPTLDVIRLELLRYGRRRQCIGCSRIDLNQVNAASVTRIHWRELVI